MYHFFAYMSRLKLIQRWSLMRSLQKENAQEHSLEVAMVAHNLALIKNRYFGGKLDASQVAVLAMYHDASEVLTGDLPTPVKYADDAIRQSYHAIEATAQERLLAMLPPEFRAEYKEFLMPQDGEAKRLVKAADKLCAYLKCLEETAAGNREFAVAQETLRQELSKFADLPEVEWFLTHFSPSFGLTLDELK